MFYGSGGFDTCAASSLIYSAFFGESAEGCPAATHLSFASPKESKQRKGDPTVCDPSLRCGYPAVLGLAGKFRN
jgi:hypothetical protein